MATASEGQRFDVARFIDERPIGTLDISGVEVVL